MDIIQELVLPVPNDHPDFAHGSLFFVGTATTIMRYAGFTILTDPNFLHQGEKVHIGYGLTSTRLTNPAIKLDELPPIDLIILSHMHEDLRKIHQRYPDIDLAMLHLGGTKVFGIMLTMDGKQGVALTRMIAPSQTPNKLTVIPIHYDDYDVFKSPLDDFVKAFIDSGLENQVRYLHQGDTYIFELAQNRT